MPREAENWDSKAVWIDKRYSQRRQVDRRRHRQDRSRPSSTTTWAGNTKVYGAILFRFRERDFDEIQHVDGVSPAWPIGYDDLEPWYTRAERLYQVHGERGTDPTEPPGRRRPTRSRPSATSRASHSCPATCARAGLNPFPLPNGILLDEAAPWRSACIRCATCDGYACPTNGKADAAVIAVEPGAALPQRHAADQRRGDPAGDRHVGPDGHRRRGRAGRRGRALLGATSSSWPAAPSTRPLCCCGRPSDDAPRRPRQRVRPGRPQPHAAQQLVADRVLEDAQPDEVPEDAGHQRLLLRRRGRATCRSRSARCRCSARATPR